MLHSAFKVLISVRSKLFFSFLAMSLVIALLGGYAVLSINQAGDVVKDTFDRPLIAITYARSASQTFAEVELALFSASEVDTAVAETATLLDDFKGDLEVAKERSISPRAASYFDDAESGLAKFEKRLAKPDALASPDTRDDLKDIGEGVKNALDIIVELQTNESFRARERAIETMQRVTRFALFALGAALLLTLGLSSWLAVTIINPLNAAASAARKISAGKLDVDIPKGGDDETGVLLKTLALMQDNIRARMGQEASLRSLAQDRLVQSLENSKDAILLTDAQDVIIVANHQVSQMFPSLAGRPLQSLPFLNGFNAAGLPHGEACQTHDGEIAFPDGRWARVNASMTQEGGRLFIWTDITEDKQKSENLRQAKRDAEAASEAKTTFMAAMSHELRTPLNAVIGFSDILASEKFGPLGNPEYLGMAEHISQSGSHLLNIVTDVLDVADGRDPAKMRAAFEPVDLQDIASFAQKTLQTEAAERGISINMKPGSLGLTVMGDVGRLQQLLINLLGNAVKFNKDKGSVILTGHRVESWVLLDISDTGIGLSQDNIDLIFAPFVQVDAGHSRSYEGVGLGLTIARKIAREHGGDLRIHSVEGQGTIVRIALPERKETANITDQAEAA